MINLKIKQAKNPHKQNKYQVHRYRKQIGGCQRERGGVGEKSERGQKIQTYKIDKSWGCNVRCYINMSIIP